ncbi:hypothetical protein CJF42_22150 [Pseudoalteromonas sp. NBT06-2]|uniref:phage virion morphogenesis protein n=1 Tax=Pseudoalteromonas sp. NBT06-2 TaxID=2025950 RepID=UPI000BA6B917|nr:phage virion morphogenesis protein [Pseudoalteromonas sp. NBT06-2]PAJ72259.1 hypothetical protein CJF42_22150 [Pseudoalteromonas sp. NBT06-2]
MLKFELDTDEALQQLGLLTLPAKKRQQILRKAGRRFRQNSLNRVKDKKNVDGTAWKSSNSKKLFKKLKQKKSTYIKTTPNSVEIGFKRQRWGKLARAHAIGLEDEYSVAESKKKLKKAKKPDYKAPATRSQAKELNRLGFKWWNKNTKKYKSISQKRISELFTVAQAGIVIKLLRPSKKNNKETWNIKRPKRELLGNTKKETRVTRQQILDDALKIF